jgi:hypothetical protein
MSYLQRSIKQFHTHIQSTPSAEWTIQHDLDRLPIVNVYVTVNGQEMIVLPSSVDAVDTNSCVLTFISPVSGVAEVF